MPFAPSPFELEDLEGLDALDELDALEDLPDAQAPGELDVWVPYSGKNRLPPQGPRSDVPLPPIDPDLSREVERRRNAPATPAAPPRAAGAPLSPYGQQKWLDADKRLLTAGNWDPVRVKTFQTDSKIVREGFKYLGTPYHWGGSDKRGFDCSGFTHQAMKDAGINVPLSWFRAKIDPRIDPKAAEGYGMKHTTRPVPGDVVIFGKSHIGIYVGNVDGKPMYMSANHGGEGTTRDSPNGGRVDIMTVASRGIAPVYYHYTGGR